MNSISAIIITKNEAHNLEECLKSLSFVDECVVVDSGSVDNTVEIAKRFGAVVIETNWPGFGPQKQRALDSAKCNWILSIDADERVSPKLQREIENKILNSDPDQNAFFLPRITSFCGEWIRHAGWYPDFHIRLFRRDFAQFSNDLVHESVILNQGDVGHFESPIVHYSFRRQEDYLRKLTQYSVLAAEQAQKKGKQSGLTKAIAFAAVDFVRMYFLKLGFLDGRAGLIVSILSAEAMFHKYLGLTLRLQQISRGELPPPKDLTE